MFFLSLTAMTLDETVRQSEQISLVIATEKLIQMIVDFS